MYNSRPRRMNYDGFPPGFALPENYSGNAFREDSEREIDTDIVIDDELSEETFIESETEQGDDTISERVDESVETSCRCTEDSCTSKKSLFSKSGIGFNVGKLFRGGIGIEELLIIGLILLIAQSENNEDVIVLLALLLFIS